MTHRRNIRKLRCTFLGLLVLSCVLFAWAAGYVVSSPLKPGESVLSLIDFDPVLIGRCRDAGRFWETLRSSPRYREFAASPQGKAFLAASPLVRSVRRSNERGRMWGHSVLDLLDLLGEETIIVVPSMRLGQGSFLFASRIGPRANLLTGLYAGLKTTRPLHTPAGEWWAVVDSSVGIAWTKAGDVLAGSDDLDLLAKFVGAARGTRREPPSLADVLSDDDAPQLALRTFKPDRGDAPAGHPKAFVLSLHPGGRRAAAKAGESAAFEQVGSNYIPSDVCAGLAWRLDPVSVWRLALDTRSETGREHMIRYAEDKVCALLDVEDFEKDALGRLTGDCVVTVSLRPDPWLSLAAGGPMPAVSFVAGIRSDPHFERQLRVALAETIGTLVQGSEQFETRMAGMEYRGRNITLVQVRRHGKQTGPAAGYFIAPDERRPGQSVIVVSTSSAWLRQAIDVHDGRATPLSREEWARGIAPYVASDRPLLGFVNGDGLLEVLARMRGRAKGGKRSRPGAEQWFSALGLIVLDGSAGKDGVVRAELRFSGDRATRTSR